MPEPSSAAHLWIKEPMIAGIEHCAVCGEYRDVQTGQVVISGLLERHHAD